MGKKKKKKENEVQSGHTPISNRPDDEDFVLEEFVSEPPSGGEGAESDSVPDDGYEAVETPELMAFDVAEAFSAPSETKLRDIAEASFGVPPPRAESVHGPDNRIKINGTSKYPWRVHASLLITARDNSTWIGTGWFVGPHTLMTAGHVVYIKGSGVPGRDGWVKKINVMPGRNGNSLPYGSVTSASFRTVVGWANSGSENYDYGAIIIPTNLGSQTGWFGYGVYSNADLQATTGNLSGYPGDKPAGTQWYGWHKVASVSARKVYYDIDSYGGQSGSAVYRIKNGGRYAFAIHAYGGATFNSGTRIVTPVFNNIKAWKA
jgi:glutamyl endopeptidase